MKIVISGKIEWDPATLAAIEAIAEQAYHDTLARILEQSRLSGLEVEYDMAGFEEAWNPVYLWPADQPIAWVNSQTGARQEGAVHPERRP